MNRKILSRCWFPILLVLLALAARWIPGPRTIDDAYITFRYARNILSGAGFVFNPGERVLGTTTGLYTLLMAFLGLLSGGAKADFPTLALGVNALADAATCVLLFQLGRRLKFPLAGAAAALGWAVASFSVTFAVGGLETSLYVFFLTAAAYAYLDLRLTWVALLAGLGVLTRPDAVILLGPIALDWFIRLIKKERAYSITWKALAAFLLPVGAWIGFASLYFGSFIPHSVSAKLLAYRLDASEALIRLLQHYATPFLTQNWIGSAAAVAVGLVAFPFLYLIGLRRTVQAEPRLWPWLLYPWIYFAFFAIANPLIFRWYLTPPLPAYTLLILVGLETMLREIFKPGPAFNPRSASSWALLLLLLALPLGGGLSDWRLHPDHGPDRPAPEMAYIQLELLYQQAAQQINPRLTPDSVLAAGDVGVLGYFTPAKILDTVGLNSPQALRYYPADPSCYVINYAIPPQLILDEAPDVVVALEVYGRQGLFQNAVFESRYQADEPIKTDMYGSNGLLIFWKK